MRRELCPAMVTKPPDAAISRVDPPATLVIGFDVETQDWKEESTKKGRYGEHGFYTITTADELLFKRMVQIGWAIGTISEDKLTLTHKKERKIQPDGFLISERAANHHHITTECAKNEGVPLKSALQEFLFDAMNVHIRGGRAVSHHIEHDATIVAHELERAQMQDMAKTWTTIARAGVCTMDPYIGKWVYTCTKPIGQPGTGCDQAGCPRTRDQPKVSSKMTLPLKDMVDWLVPGNSEVKARAHSADADAVMHCLVYYELTRLVAMARDLGELA